MWRRCVWSHVCDRWYVTKLCVKFMYVTDSLWQSCVLSLCVWSYCMVGGDGRTEEEEARDTESKTRTPHKVVGKYIYTYFYIYIAHIWYECLHLFIYVCVYWCFIHLSYMQTLVFIYTYMYIHTCSDPPRLTSPRTRMLTRIITNPWSHSAVSAKEVVQSMQREAWSVAAWNIKSRRWSG